ncbi:hypothetical protein AVEN_30522-1 [Araneus ventricosus]|uniref:Uncharacterized protein n=1 Tax=Araneus ventricosus TaxID=182803 RepID=A0A4Y2J7V8_ARAVE|nr:hypothetical protein AVEN_30522-1 [Araneus ventricosus]
MDFTDTALLYILLGTVLKERQKTKRKVWARKWLLRRKQKGCYENLMKELALEEKHKVHWHINWRDSASEAFVPLVKKRWTIG